MTFIIIVVSGLIILDLYSRIKRLNTTITTLASRLDERHAEYEDRFNEIENPTTHDEGLREYEY